MSTTTIGPTPTMSWSHSRARLLEEDCARRYYWQYYGAHGGWDADAPDETRIAYRLKQLSTLDMVLGQEIHTRAQEIAEAIRGREEPPHLEVLIERTRNALNRVWRGSKNASAFIRAPKRQPMLLESYYGLPTSNDRLLSLRAKLRECIRNLATWPGWEEVRAAPIDEVLLFDSTDPVVMQDMPIYAAPDLVFRAPDGPWQVVDWKSGSAAGGPEQLSLYALYLRERGDIPDFDGSCVGRLVLLRDADEEIVPIQPPHLAVAERRIQRSLREMKGYLVEYDAGRNEALPRDQFPLPVDTDRCRYCPFYELCEQELENPSYRGPF